jgi:transcriptional regulator with XRE-family HTH domain
MAMMTPEQTQEIIQWRDKKLSPKEIARQMGLRPAEVTAFLRDYAEQNPTAKALLPLLGCFVNASTADQLLPKTSISKMLLNKALDSIVGSGSTGLGEVLVVRKEGIRYEVSGFLVDYWCLGVKDALFKKCDERKYEALIERIEKTFSEPLQEISLEQAQAIVFGSIDYAATLGFKPHDDFQRAKQSLGERLENLQSIQFGRDGKPFYFCGPHDDQMKIIQTLKENVGDGNFDYAAKL